MKKFAFSLQKLMDYRTQVLNLERGTLGEMNLALHRMEDERDALCSEQRSLGRELNEKCAKGTTAMEILQHKLYIEALGEAIVAKGDQIALQTQAVERQMEKVRETKVELSTMEKLKLKKLDEYSEQVRKAEELFIDEFVGHQHSVAGHL